MKTKRCSKCKTAKPVKAFGKHPDHTDGLFSYCKKCILEYNQTPEQKEKNRANNKRWRVKNKLLLQSKEYKEHQREIMNKPENKKKAKERQQTDTYKIGQRRRHLGRGYKMTPEEYNAFFSAQGGVCCLCKKPETKTKFGKVMSLSIDHNHACCPGVKTCGKCIRGLLCYKCNTILGYVDDNKELLKVMLKNIIDYLEEFEGIGVLEMETSLTYDPKPDMEWYEKYVSEKIEQVA